MSSPTAGSLMSGKEISLNVVFRKYDDGTVVAECLEIPGCVSEGETEEEAKANISNAINGCLSVMMEDLFASTSKQQSVDEPSGLSWNEVFSVVPPHLLAEHGAMGD